MLSVALHTLRIRRAAGTFLALCLGVALITAMGLALAGSGDAPAEHGSDREREALVTAVALLGTAAGVSGFVSVFVVASTFAFSVAQRRRELGLLRAAGATPRQVRRLVFREAALVGVLASAAGCVLGGYAAPRLVRWLVRHDLAPAWLTVGSAHWPYHLAFWTGLAVAATGVAAASWRAGRIAPMEALREAAVDRGTMTPGRWLFGVGLLLTGVGLLVFTLFTDPSELLRRKTYTSRPMLLITAGALLAPVLVGPLVRLLCWLPARLPGATGLLVRENATTGVRRTAALAAPVLLVVGLAGSLLGTTAMLGAARGAEWDGQTAADFVVTAPDGAGFDARTVARVRALPGVQVSATASTTVSVLEEGTALVESEAWAAEPRELAAVARLPLVAGRVADLDDRSLIVNEEWERHTVGEWVEVRRGDGTRVTLRIAAVMRIGTGGNGAYVTPRNAPGATVDRLEVRLAQGAEPDAAQSGAAQPDAAQPDAAHPVATALRSAVSPVGGTVLTREQWIAASQPGNGRETRLGHLLVLGIGLVYAAISLVNALVMATSDRVRELAALRLAGATSGQVLRLVATEALTVVAVGTLLGLGAATLNLLGVWTALALLGVGAPILLPWTVIGAAAAACAALAVAAAVLPAAVALRGGPPARLAGVRE